jgi:hypothetical protein
MVVFAWVSGCSANTSSKVWLGPPGWSRGVQQGVSNVNSPIALGLDEVGHLYLFGFTADEPPAPRLQQVDPEGNLVWEQEYTEFTSQTPRIPKLVVGTQSVDLFWLDGRGLNRLTTDIQGEPQGPAAVLTTGWIVDSYDVAMYGGLTSVWVGVVEGDTGLWTLETGGEWVLVDSEGTRPDAAFDAQGNLHLAWAHMPANRIETEFVYGFFPAGDLEAGRYHVVIQPEFRTTDDIDGPAIGLVGEKAYIFWTNTIKTGMQAGEIVSSYISFWQGQQTYIPHGTRITVPREAEIEHEVLFEDHFVTGPRMEWTLQNQGTTQLLALTPNQTYGPQLVIALTAKVSLHSQPSQTQIALLFFGEEGYTSYQLLTQSQAASVNPTLLSDPNGHLYLTWMEKNGGGLNVFYLATTSPIMQTFMNEVTTDAIGGMIGEALFGLVSGMVMVPFMLIWLVPPMILLGITAKLRRPDMQLSSPRLLVSFALSLAGYWFIKLGMVPTMRSIVPFLVWIPVIPAGWQLVLRIGVPSIIAAIGLYIAYRATYGRDRRSPFLFIVIYAIIDGLLTMAVYGYSIMGF